MEDNRKILYDVVYEKMFDAINSSHPISENLRELIYENSSPYDFSKDEFLLTENKECNVLFFIVKGFCSCFYNKDGKECILRFAKECQFCTSWYSFLGRKKSLINIKATEDTTVVLIKRENFDYLLDECPEFVSVFCKALGAYAIESEERAYRMRSNLVEGRIRFYKETHEIHYLMKHVPNYSIASFLNMTQETFSKKLAKLNKERE